jgi:hypothetical protein
VRLRAHRRMNVLVVRLEWGACMRLSRIPQTPLFPLLHLGRSSAVDRVADCAVGRGERFVTGC